MREDIEKALEKIRPALQADGGDIDLIDVDEENGVVKVQLKGACAGCPSAQMTLQMGVEKAIREEVPQVKKVVAVP